MQQSIGDALKSFFAKRKIDSRIAAMKIAEDWEGIMGKTVARYTDSIQMKGKTLYIKTPVPILKQDLLSNKLSLIQKINQHYGSEVLEDIKVY